MSNTGGGEMRSVARLPYLCRDDVANGYQDLYTPIMRVGQTMLHGPKTWRALRGVLSSIDNGPLDPQLRELAMLQVGYLANCAYQYSHHVKIALGAGVQPSEILAIALESDGQSSGLSELKKATLAAAREMTLNFVVTDKTFAVLQEHLAVEALMDLLHVIGTYNGLVRVWDSLKIEVEDDYLKYLADFPLKAGRVCRPVRDG